MEILRTFDDQTKGVYLVKFVDCPIYNTPADYEEELSKSFDQLTDVQYVRKSIAHLDSGWKIGDYKHRTLKELSGLVLEEINDLIVLFNDLKEQSQEIPLDWLLDHFKLLSKSDALSKPHRLKLKCYEYGSFLRLYALQIDKDCVLITGIAIKLATKMQDAVQTQLELDKLDYLRSWIIKNNIIHSEDLL